MKAVIDTNVLISGLFWNGTPKRVLLSWIAKHFEWVATPEILEEYWRSFDQLSRIYGTPKDGYDFLRFLGSNVTIAAPVHFHEQVCSDPDDDKFVSAALAGSASIIATGDKALLKVDGYQGLRIIKPAVFLKLIARNP